MAVVYQRTGRWRALGAACLVALLAVFAPPAAASPQSETLALRHFMEGKKAFDGGRFEEALIVFQHSLELMPSPNSRLYIALCHRALGKVGSAYSGFRRAAQEASDRLAATGEKRYAATRNSASAEAAEIERKVPWLTLALPAEAPAGLALTLDGELVLRADWGTAIAVDPGEHEIAARGPRLAPFQRRVNLTLGEKLRVDVPVTRLPTATLRLRLHSRPDGLAVELDGRPLPPREVEQPLLLDVGAHRLVLRAPGHADYVWRRTLADREDLELQVDLRARRSGTPRWLFYTVSGGAAASLVLGTVFALSAESTAQEQEARDALLRDPQALEDVRSDRTTAKVLFVAGGALAVTAGVLFFTTRWSGGPARERRAVRAVVGPGQLGLAVGGSF